MISFITFAISVVSIVLAYCYFYRDSSKKPPGPRGIPLIGNVLSLDKNPHKTIHRWGKEYGPIVFARFGINPVLIVTGIKEIREVLSSPVFSGRPDLKAINITSGGKHGVTASEGEEWMEQRRFILRNLRDFGFAKQSMETFIHDEIEILLQWIQENEGKVVTVHNKFGVAVINALWRILAGKGHKRLELDNVATKLQEKAFEIFRTVSPLLLFFPQLEKILPYFFNWDKITPFLDEFNSIFDEALKSHLDDPPASSDDSRDLIDVYLNEINKTTDPNSSFYKEKGRKSLLTIVSDLYFAGTATTSSTLHWSILYLIMNPKVQLKLQKEIDEVIGKNRSPSLKDKINTPYVEAFMLEVFRFSSIAPINLLHNTMENTNFHGYDIKKDTLVITSLYSCLHDEKVWGDPQNFRPERFLSPDEKTVLRNLNENLIPFSAGKRVCVGETFAKDQIYLFITSMIQKYDILPDPNATAPYTYDSVPGIFLDAKPYTLIFRERK